MIISCQTLSFESAGRSMSFIVENGKSLGTCFCFTSSISNGGVRYWRQPSSNVVLNVLASGIGY